MLKFVYVTDLHGWESGYDAVLAWAVKEDVSIIVNGGDMLPKGDSIYNMQKRFINGYLRDHVARCADHGIRYYGMLGNDDLRARLKYWDNLVAANDNLFDLTSGWHEMGSGLVIRGMNYVPDAPFGLKDWFVLDSPGWERPLDCSRPILSGPNGFERIEDIDQFFAERPTLAQLLADAAEGVTDWRRAIFVSHCPPVATGLGVLGGILRGKDVGSPAVRAWIEEHQPLLTLHGHIHESPDVTYTRKARIGQTACWQPGQKAQLAATCSLVEIEGENIAFETRFLRVGEDADA